MCPLAEERIDRYYDKIHAIHERLALLDEWLLDLDDEPSCLMVKTQYAVFKVYQEMVEGLMDLIAMALRDQNVPPHDDYSNIDRISFFSKDDKEVIREMNGLRNRVVHKYNSTDSTLALERIEYLAPFFPHYIGLFEIWIRESS